MPRRETVTSPDIALNSRLLVHFDDKSTIYVKRDIYGYHVRGRPTFSVDTKAQLDAALALMAEDRGGSTQFSL